MLDVHDLRKSYGTREAVRGLSFRVGPGEVLGLVGPNGAGKTTTLRCLCGILPPTGGGVVIDGHDLALDPVGAKGRLAFVPDEPRLFEGLTVEEHLRFYARLYRVESGEERIPVLLRECELEDRGESLPAALSRGMKQKLAIACALIHDPGLLLLDEPLTGLDPIAIRKIKDSIRQRARAGAAVVVSSHLLALVEELADRVLLLLAGVRAAYGTVDELRAAHPELGEGASLEDVFMRVVAGPGAPPGPPGGPPGNA